MRQASELATLVEAITGVVAHKKSFGLIYIAAKE
jgi:hypothetical protein